MQLRQTCLVADLRRSAKKKHQVSGSISRWISSEHLVEIEANNSSSWGQVLKLGHYTMLLIGGLWREDASLLQNGFHFARNPWISIYLFPLSDLLQPSKYMTSRFYTWDSKVSGSTTQPGSSIFGASVSSRSGRKIMHLNMI